jgi:hypothetical protein
MVLSVQDHIAALIIYSKYTVQIEAATLVLVPVTVLTITGALLITVIITLAVTTLLMVHPVVVANISIIIVMPPLVVRGVTTPSPINTPITMILGNIIVLVPPRENAIYFTIGIAMV